MHSSGPIGDPDTDGDEIGNNADEDDDGDGVPDKDDPAPLDPDSSAFWVRGSLGVRSDIVLDSDTNNPSNPFARNNEPGVEARLRVGSSYRQPVGYPWLRQPS